MAIFSLNTISFTIRKGFRLLSCEMAYFLKTLGAIKKILTWILVLSLEKGQHNSLILRQNKHIHNVHNCQL